MQLLKDGTMHSGHCQEMLDTNRRLGGCGGVDLSPSQDDSARAAAVDPRSCSRSALAQTPLVRSKGIDKDGGFSYPVTGVTIGVAPRG